MGVCIYTHEQTAAFCTVRECMHVRERVGMHTQDDTQDDAYIQIDTIPCVQIYTDKYRSLFFDALRGLLELGFSQAQLDPYRLMVLLECVCMCVCVHPL